MVRLDEDDNIVNFVPKKAFNYNDIAYYYKTVNIYKFDKKFIASNYIPFLEAYITALGNNEYYEQVLRVITLLDKCDLKALPLQGEKWYEIDDVQDLDIAETLLQRRVYRFIKSAMEVIGVFLLYWISAIWSILIFHLNGW